MVVVRMRTASPSSIRPSLTSPAHAWITAMHVVTSQLTGRSERKEPSARPRSSSAPSVRCAMRWVRATASGVICSATAWAIAL